MLNTQQKQQQQKNPTIDFEKSDSGFLGFFLQHQQNLKWFDIKYELDSKLFSINEPYLMKTERDSLIKLKQETINNETINEADNNNDNDLDNKKPVPTTTLKANNNGLRKRKKNLDKKCALLDGNFSSIEERQMAQKLIEKYLNNQNNNNNNNNSVLNNNTNSTNNSNNKKTLLKSINLKEKDSNPEAQTFVNSLFLNRFESLNYRTKLFCNPYYKTIKVKFGLSNFFIPPRCSFAGIDVMEGVRMLNRYLKLALIECRDNKSSSNQSLICCKNPFILIMDPAWDNNKSIKRKRTYETVSLDYMKRLCKETKYLLDSISNLRQMRLKLYSHYNQTSPMICAIWTTNLDKQFVIDEMLPLMNMKLSYVLKWHKITKIGLPVKVHGGQEYLILAEQSNNQQNSSNNNKKDDHKNGIIVSIPSAIHSHKPNIIPIIRQLYNFDDNGFDGLHCSTTDPNDSKLIIPTTSTIINNNNNNNGNGNNADMDDDPNSRLVANEFINSLCGIELFARYLQTGFHSIGFECIKLQNEKLFNVEAE